MKILFYGFGHGHIYGLYRKVAEDPEIEIAACIEEDEEMAAAAERELGIQILRDGYETWLQTDVDAVAIGKAYTLRGKAAILALQAGKHVIADKPLCTKLEELDAMEQLAESKGLQIACMLDLRYLTQSALAAELLPTLGKIHNISFTGQHFLNPDGRQKWYFEGFQGGTINDIAIHGVDLVRVLTGKEFTKVDFARSWNGFASMYPDFRDCAVFAAQLEDGCQVMADVSYAAPSMPVPTYWNFKFWCEKGMLTFHMHDPHVTVYGMDAAKPEIHEGKPCTKDYLQDFKYAIADGSDSMTESVIASTRTVLQMQQLADQI